MALLPMLLPLLAAAGPATTGIHPLDGAWDFALLHEGQELTDIATIATDSVATVPGSWDAQGAGNATDRLRSNWLGKALYRRQVSAPPMEDGDTAWLVVERPKRAVVAHVDGHAVGSHVGYLTDLEAEITAQLKGQAQVTLELVVDALWGQENVPPLGTCPFSFGQACTAAAGPAQKGAPSPADQMVGSLDLILPWGAPGDWGGLYGHVYIAVRKRLTVGNLLVVTPGAPPDGTVQLQVELFGGPRRAGDRCRVEIVREGRGRVEATTEAPLTAGGCAPSAKVPNPELWWPHAPALYTAVVSVLGGGAALSTR
eukprot:COSAG04_NODE_2104_length_4778_cov_3.530883_5_plen_313_part_00